MDSPESEEQLSPDELADLTPEDLDILLREAAEEDTRFLADWRTPISLIDLFFMSR